MSWLLLWVTKAVLYLHHQHKVVLQIAKWITYFCLQDPNQKMNQTRCLFVGLLTRMIHHHTLQYLLSFSQPFTCLFKLQMVLENLHLNLLSEISAEKNLVEIETRFYCLYVKGLKGRERTQKLVFIFTFNNTFSLMTLNSNRSKFINL